MPDSQPSPPFYAVTFLILAAFFVIGSLNMTWESWRAALRRQGSAMPAPVPTRRAAPPAWQVRQVAAQTPASAATAPAFDGVLADWLRELPLCPLCPAPLMAQPHTGETMVLWPCPEHFTQFARERGGRLSRALVERQLSPLVVQQYTHHHS